MDVCLSLLYFPAVSEVFFLHLLHQFKCCGSNSSADWAESVYIRSGAKGRKVPDSCCKTITNMCGIRDHPSNIYKVEVSVWTVSGVGGGEGFICISLMSRDVSIEAVWRERSRKKNSHHIQTVYITLFAVRLQQHSHINWCNMKTIFVFHLGWLHH